MTSLRHNEDLGAGVTEPRDGYLDTARDCILDVGWRRTTLTEVARRAGVSRMTIYRTWSDMPQLLGDLMTREWGTIVNDVHRRPAPHDQAGHQPSRDLDPVAELRDDLVEVVRTLRSNELFVRIIELDPELLLPYLLARRGRSQDNLLAVLQQVIAHGQTAGAVRAGDPTLIARSLVLAVHGFVLSAQTMVDDTVSEADLDHELARLVERTLT